MDHAFDRRKRLALQDPQKLEIALDARRIDPHAPHQCLDRCRLVLGRDDVGARFDLGLVYALMSNHFHLLLEVHRFPPAGILQSLLTGYAGRLPSRMARARFAAVRSQQRWSQA